MTDSDPPTGGTNETATEWTPDSPDTEASVFYQINEGEVTVTSGRTLTEADVTNFAGVSGDFNHLHLDAERMADSMFGARIVHGLLVLSAATGLFWQNRSPEERASVVAFYGMDELRFRAPVFIDDTIHLEATVTEKTEKPDGPGSGTVRYDIDIVNQSGTTVISCELLSLLR
jgi:acyl dehydratase